MIHFLLKCSLFYYFFGDIRSFFGEVSHFYNESLRIPPSPALEQNIAVGRKLISSMSGSNFAWSAKTEIWAEGTEATGGRSLMWVFFGGRLLVSRGKWGKKTVQNAFREGKNAPQNFWSIPFRFFEKNLQIEIHTVDGTTWDVDNGIFTISTGDRRISGCHQQYFQIGLHRIQMAPAKEAPAWFLPPGGWSQLAQLDIHGTLRVLQRTPGYCQDQTKQV